MKADRVLERTGTLVAVLAEELIFLDESSSGHCKLLEC
jgi:hypothetical protein